MMHIAFFSDQHPATLGGLQVSLGLQRAALEHLGHTVTVCAPRSTRTPSMRFARSHDVLLLSVQVGEHSACWAGRSMDRVVDAGFAKLPPVDVVHVQADVWGSWNGYRFAERHGLPLVHTMHTDLETGLPAVVPLPSLGFRALFAAQRRHLRTAPIGSLAEYIQATAHRADAVIAPSGHTADRLRGYGVRAPIDVVPTGVDGTLVRSALAEPYRPASRPRLLWAGRVSPEKRLDETITAFADAHVDAELHVVGGGSDLDRCRRLAAQAGVAHRVVFHGTLSHSATLQRMRQADLVLQTSLGYETQGLTVYEALAVGTPVLARDPLVAAELPADRCVGTDDASVAALRRAIHGAVTHRLGGARVPWGATQSERTDELLGIYRRVLVARARANQQEVSHA